MNELSAEMERYISEHCEDFRLRHPEYGDFTTEQILQLSPITELDIRQIKLNYAEKLELRIGDLKEEIAHDEEIVKSAINHQMVTEARQDLIAERNLLQKYEAELNSIMAELSPNKEEDEDYEPGRI